MAVFSFDQTLADVRNVYEQLTGLPAPKIDVKNPRFPFSPGVDPVSMVQSEINYLNLFLINSGLSLQLSKVPTWAPPSEVYETPDEYVICLEVAGMSEKDISVNVLNNTLVVRGTRRFRRVSEDAQYRSSERVYGTFERFFPIPGHAQLDKPQVRLANGLVEIVFAKSGDSDKSHDDERSQKHTRGDVKK